MATYTFPVSGNVLARSTAITPEFLLPDFYNPQIWASGASGLTPYAVSGVVTGGFADGVSDGNGGMWVVGNSGFIADVTASGAVISSFVTPVNTAFTGIALSSGGVAYAMSSNGTIYAASGSSATALSPSFDTLCRGLIASGSTL